MRRRLFLVLAALAPLAAGCVTIGPNYDPAAVGQLTPGMDRAQVIALLGKPSTTVTLGDGTQQLMWVHSRGSMFGADARALTLIFGADGKFISMLSNTQSTFR